MCVLLAACGQPATDDVPDGIRVVTTVSPITNIAANVAGDLARIEGIVPEGENSHEFEPPPSVARTLASADVLFVNGLNLETPTIELAEGNMREGAEVVKLGELALEPEEYIYDFSFPREEGDPNPHLWTEPAYGKAYAKAIAGKLADLDPGNAGAYERNAAAFEARVDAFAAALRTASESVAPDKRKLLTYHDSFPYFARTYGWTIVGAVQPSDLSEPSPRDVTRLIEQIRTEGVPAIFGSEVFPSPVLRTIAAETGARYIEDLRDDDLPGEPGQPGHTYLALLAFDYTTIVDALGGDASALESVDTSNVVEDRAVYA